MTAKPPDFRMSLIDAAADYIDEGMMPAAARALRAALERSEDDRVARWIERAENGSEAVELARELRAEVAVLRRQQAGSSSPGFLAPETG